MSTSSKPTEELPFRKRLLAMIAPTLPGRLRFPLLGLPSGELRENWEKQIPGHRVEAGPGGRLHHLPHGIAWSRGAHLDALYRLIHPLSPGLNCGMDFWMLKRQRFFPRVKSLPPETVSLVTDGHGNYYHWLFDVLPRFAALPPETLSQRHYLVSQEQPFQRETFELLGIPGSSRTPAERMCFYTAHDLMVPATSLGVSPKNVEFVRSLLVQRIDPEVNAPSYPRIYISRRQASSRRLVNEEELHPLLEKYGFHVFCAEQLSFKEQVAVFNRAEIVLAPHGAALANLIFAHPGARVIEILPEGLREANAGPFFLYEGLAKAAGLNYERILARPVDPSAIHAGDMHLEPEKLEQVLRGVGSSF